MNEKNGGWSISSEAVKGLWKAWNTLRNSIADGNVIKMRNGLQRILDAISTESHLAQLELVDSKGTIMFILSSFPKDWEQGEKSNVKRIFNQLLLDSVGTRVRKGSFVDFVISLIREKKLEKESVEGPKYIILACERGGADQSLGGHYRIYPINIEASNEEEILEDLIKEKQYLFIPGIEDPFLPKIQPWLKRLVVIPNIWPSDGLPEISAIIAFILNPKVEEEGKRFEFKKQLWELRETLLFLTSYLQSVASTIQSFLVSQASVEDSKRFSEELFISEWKKNLREKTDEYDQSRRSSDEIEIKRLMTNVLKIESEFVKMAVFRDIGKYTCKKPFVANIIHDHFELFIKALDPYNPEWKEKALNYIREQYHPPMDQPEEEYWQRISEKIVPSALKHVQCLYPYMDAQSLNGYLKEVVAPLIRLLLFYYIGLPRNERLDNPTERQKYELALSALENAYVDSDSEGKATICEILDEIIKNATKAKNGAIEERLIITLLLALAKDKGEQRNKLVELTASALKAWEDKKKAPLDLAMRPLAFLEPIQIQEILEKLENGDIIHEQLTNLLEIKSKIIRFKSKRKEFLRPLQVFSVLSSKGGVGKTTLSLGLATYLADHRSRKVCVIDLDFLGPTYNYILGAQGLKPDKISLNEYIWAKHLPELVEQAKINRETEKTMKQIFKGKTFWKTRFERLSKLEETEILERFLLETPIPGLRVIACSPNSQLQGLMLPFLMNEQGLKIIGGILDAFLLSLQKEGYEYVIFDSPAELRDLAMIAARLSTLYGGKNIFVSSLFFPSIATILEMLSEPLFVQGNNYLMINKARKLDQKYVDSKQAFVDYLSTLESDDKSILLSKALLEILVNVKYCGFVPWTEYLERFLEKPWGDGKKRKQDHITTENKLGEHIKPIIENG